MDSETKYSCIILFLQFQFPPTFVRVFFDRSSTRMPFFRRFVEQWSNKTKIDQKHESYLPIMNRGLAKFLFCHNTIIE